MCARKTSALLLAGVATFALMVGCSSSGEPESAAPEPGETATTTPTATEGGSPDPLAGEWRTSFTCQDAVRAVERRLGSHWKGWEPENAAPGEPCSGEAGVTHELLARFSDGLMALCQPTGLCDVHATYAYPEASVLRIDDTEGNLCEPGKTCPIDWTFEISGNQLRFRVAEDPWTISTWEAAPWIRSS